MNSGSSFCSLRMAALELSKVLFYTISNPTENMVINKAFVHVLVTYLFVE